MQTHVFLAILVAALLHAGWNSVVKLDIDRRSSVLLLAIVQALAALPILPFVQQPDSSAYAWIVAAALLHTGYKIFLVEAYARVDLSQAYPLARGTAPLLVTLFSVLVLGEAFSSGSLVGVGLISVGIFVMALRGGHIDRLRGTALFFVIGTAGFTASYTLVDGIGARIAGTSSGFILWMVIGDAIGMLIYSAAARGRSAFSGLKPAWKTGTAAGLMSLGSYWIAVWAFTKAPIALVASLRESSILFAIIISTLLLGESVSRWRWASGCAIFCGVIFIKL
ncbi:DMT family transporter [uncultured Ruegeria sp.]|uniref:DMT family transporter n=1 Tax=uncultured Ruegeria sp. TaxID=259304 RepID=UPI002617E22B|nr:DMT family transporter [uncultured Ruegeria sp.]